MSEIDLCDTCKWFHIGCPEESEHFECPYYDDKHK